MGDIAPAEGWLRLVSPLEALVGFALLTATVSWVLEIYPTLTRRRVLAIRLAVLRNADPATLQIDCTEGAMLLDSLSTKSCGSASASPGTPRRTTSMTGRITRRWQP
ncbi:hypothetical protein [Streptomyces sp. NPDC102476]|uniref:hypothetical protein n=1 Tax=Streptomyces sp. NPDC102476 TaxID=3366181 RepID=UPI0037FA381A